MDGRPHAGPCREQATPPLSAAAQTHLQTGRGAGRAPLPQQAAGRCCPRVTWGCVVCRDTGAPGGVLPRAVLSKPKCLQGSRRSQSHRVLASQLKQGEVGLFTRVRISRKHFTSYVRCFGMYGVPACPASGRTVPVDPVGLASCRPPRSSTGHPASCSEGHTWQALSMCYWPPTRTPGARYVNTMWRHLAVGSQLAASPEHCSVPWVPGTHVGCWRSW